MQTMEIATREQNNVLIFDIKGELDAKAAPELKERLTDKINQGHTRVLVNLSDISYLDSAGLGVLVSGLKIATRQNGDLRMWGLQEEVKNIFQLTRLNKVFQIFESEEQALGSYT
ncbi:MAG TPA: STAS domain-containing protein [bacterium]|nr:STAS domain-containing protein [bacterium]